LFEASAPIYTEALAAGLGDQDTAAVFAVLDKAHHNPDGPEQESSFHHGRPGQLGSVPNLR